MLVDGGLEILIIVEIFIIQVVIKPFAVILLMYRYWYCSTGLSNRMFTRYRYWENGLTGKYSNTDGTAGSSSGGTNSDKTEPENAILSYVVSLSSTRTWKAYDDNLGKENSEDQFLQNLLHIHHQLKLSIQIMLIQMTILI